MVVGHREYATWGQRALAFLLDQLFALVAVGGAMAVLFVPVAALLAVGGDEPSPWVVGVAGLAMVAFFVAANALVYWNIGWRQGRTGQSLGKQVLGIEVVWEADGTHIMAGSGLLRALLAGLLGGFCFLSYLWPLWDDRRRTWHDLALKTLVVTCDPTPDSRRPPLPGGPPSGALPGAHPRPPGPPAGQGPGGSYPPPP